MAKKSGASSKVSGTESKEVASEQKAEPKEDIVKKEVIVERKPEKVISERTVTFETSKFETIDFGTKKFIEIALKKAITEQGENEFMSISRGFYYGDTKDNKRYTDSIAMPRDKQFIDKLAKALMKISG